MRRTIHVLAVVAFVATVLVGNTSAATADRSSRRHASAANEYERTLTLKVYRGGEWGWHVIHGRTAVGHLSSDARACIREQVVHVQYRRTAQQAWARVHNGKTDRRGEFGVTLWKGEHPRGDYRAVAPERSLASGGVCLRAVSRVRYHPR